MKKWSVYIYNSYKQKKAFYKSFQQENHDFSDESIDYEDIFKYK